MTNIIGEAVWVNYLLEGQFLVDVTDFHNASFNTAKTKQQKKAQKVISIKTWRKCFKALFALSKILVYVQTTSFPSETI